MYEVMLVTLGASLMLFYLIKSMQATMIELYKKGKQWKSF